MATNHRRRWLSFSLRGLLIVIAALAVWLGLLVNGAREQQAAVMLIRQYDPLCNVGYDAERFNLFMLGPNTSSGGGDSGGSGVRLTGWAPAWLEAGLGKDFFHTIESASFGDGAQQSLGPEDEAELFRRISRLRHLNQLVLNFPVRAESVAEIAKLPRLVWLEFSKPCPTLGDEALRTLSGMSRLEALTICDAPITDAGLAHLAKMRRLKWLSLGEFGASPQTDNSFQVTDDGLRQLAALGGLEELSLNLPAMTGRGLEHLRTLTNLKWLYLDSPALDDGDLRALDALTNLEAFYFMGKATEEADSGAGSRKRGDLPHLKELRSQGARLAE